MEPEQVETFFQLLGLLSLLIIGYYRRASRKDTSQTAKEPEEIHWEKNYFKYIRAIMGLFYILAFGYSLTPIIKSFFPIDSYTKILQIELPFVLRMLGALGVLVSTIFLAWTTKTLGPHFSPSLEIHDDHQLVTTGPYRLVRHPMYVGNVIWIVSFTLLSAWWIFSIYLIMFVVFIMIIRTPQEEQMLLKKFGEQYQQYMNETGKFFPKLK